MSRRSTSPATAQPYRTVIPAKAGISHHEDPMSAQRLLELYDRVADAPDAVERLRRFVLDLAVRGKLVQQDANAGPAKELVEKIEIAKSKLQKRRRGSDPETFQPLKAGDEPFSLPKAWLWVPAVFPTLSVPDRGKKIKTKQVLESGKFPVVDQGKVLVRGYWNDPEKVIKVSDPLLVFGDHTRETKLIDFDFVVGADGVKILQPIYIYPKYYHLAVQWLPLESRGYGRHFKLLRASSIPLPPLEEQHRIVAKVNDLMALLDRLETTRTRREDTRTRLTTASLTRLTAPEATEADFPAHARFALDNMDHLTGRPEQIKVLRQTIFSLAVRGKLVEQDPADEPASELLKQISADKKNRAVSARDRKAGEIKPLKGTSTLFDLPPSWVCVAFGDITISRDGERVPVSKADRENRAKIYDYYGASGVIDKIDDYLFDKPLLLIGEDGANLLNRSTPIAFIARGKYWVNNHAHVIDGLCEEYLRYLELFINTTDLKPFVTGTAQPKMNQAKMNSIPVALPPLAEQHRIVEEVDALMTLCSRLEGALENTEMRRAHLLENLLNKALSGDTGNSAEPPEANFPSE